MDPIYLDYNATTPIDPQVSETILPFITHNYGNPSSTHDYGKVASDAVNHARNQVSAMLNCNPEEIIFTSGGTESNNHALKGIANAYRNRGNHIITSSVEHPAVLEVCQWLETQGFRITYLPVDNFGSINLNELETIITSDTILITIMHANNEVGTIQPIREITQIAHSRNVLVHTDAAQSAGKILVDVQNLGVDLLSLAGHKLYAPKGIGALFVREGISLSKLMHGAGHERGARAGTENVIHITGLGKACEMINYNLDHYSAHMSEMRNALEKGLNINLPNSLFNGHPTERLPNTLSVSFRGLEADTLLSKLNRIAISAGAACHSDRIEISSVLHAMSLPVDYAMGTLRISTGRYTTASEIEIAINDITEAVNKEYKVKGSKV